MSAWVEGFNEGFDEAHRQGVGGEASRGWLVEKVVPLLKDHVDTESLYHVADHIADALLSEVGEDVDTVSEDAILKVLRTPLTARWFVNDLETATGLQANEMYPALARLEQSGQVTSGWQGTGLFPRRRWYELEES